LKEQSQKYKSLEDELAFTKEALLEVKLREKALAEEKKKALSIYLEDKMHLEEEICKLAAKCQSNEQFISQLEDDSLKAKNCNIRLENKMRKMSISF
jgi:hypothetical protein